MQIEVPYTITRKAAMRNSYRGAKMAGFCNIAQLEQNLCLLTKSRMVLDFHMPSNLVLLLIPKTKQSFQRLEDPQGWWLKSYITDFKKPYLDIKY